MLMDSSPPFGYFNLPVILSQNAVKRVHSSQKLVCFTGAESRAEAGDRP